jgi:hypothetical protein
MYLLDSRLFLLGILIFKGLTARRLYKSFGVKRLITESTKLSSTLSKHKGKAYPI